MKYSVIFFLTFSIAGKSQSVDFHPDSIIGQLKKESGNAEKAHLIMQVACFAEDDLSPSDREYLTATLLQWYRSNPDPAVHSAIDYLFRHSKTSDTLRKIDWTLKAELERRGTRHSFT